MAAEPQGGWSERPNRCLIRFPVVARPSGAEEHLFARAISANLSVTGMYIRGALSPLFS